MTNRVIPVVRRMPVIVSFLLFRRCLGSVTYSTFPDLTLAVACPNSGLNLASIKAESGPIVSPSATITRVAAYRFRLGLLHAG